ncbi:MAG: inositol monophosphatase family protein [Elainellaceae cyanobacterium]
MEFWDRVLTFAENTTSRIGEQILKDFGTVEATEKADGSLVTRCDQWADEEIRRAIADEFPDHGVISEETAHIFPNADWCWVIDPIDGTTNFTRGIPLWGISLGLLYRGTPVFGYVALPPIRQTFHGYWPGDSGLEMPAGAFKDGQSTRSQEAEPSSSQFFSLCARSISVLNQARPFPCKIRMLGVATYNLLLVAAGIALGGVEATPKIWDIAAVWVIVQAAGGTWVPLNGPIFPLTPGNHYGVKAFPTLVVSHKVLVPVFQPLVQSVL